MGRRARPKQRIFIIFQNPGKDSPRISRQRLSREWLGGNQLHKLGRCRLQLAAFPRGRLASVLHRLMRGNCRGRAGTRVVVSRPDCHPANRTCQAVGSQASGAPHRILTAGHAGQLQRSGRRLRITRIPAQALPGLPQKSPPKAVEEVEGLRFSVIARPAS